MIRRRLFAYTLMMTAGITSGYLIAEQAAFAGGLLFMLAAGISSYIMLKVQDSDDGSSYYLKECVFLILSMTAGFMIMICSYIGYESELASIRGAGDIEYAEGSVTAVILRGEGCRITMDRVIVSSEEGPKVRLRYKTLVTIYNSDITPEEIAGKRIKAQGIFREIPTADNPGCFDYRIYLRSIGTGSMLRADNIEILPDEDGPGSIRSMWTNYIFHIREKFLAGHGDDTVRGFMRGVIFGDKSEIDDEIRNDFNVNATGHILAVSGLHIGFLYSLLRILTGKKRSLPVALLIICLIFMYGEMTMWSASTMRSVMVLSISLMSLYVRRPFDLLTSVSAAAVFILAREPYQLFNSGFQLSFLALLGIAFLAKPLASFIGEYFGVIIAVQLGTAPLTAFIFHRFNAASILINIPVIAIASVLVPASIVLLAVMAAAGSVPGLATQITGDIAELIIRLNGILAGDGGFSSGVTRANAGVLLLIYLLIFAASSEWMRVRILRKRYSDIRSAFICILVISIIAGIATYNTFADDEVVFVSVGQGDCTHIRSGGKDILIDGGGDVYRNTGKDTLMPYLLANRADRVELALVTHLHTDHYLGIFQLTEVYPVGAVGIPSDYRKAIESGGSGEFVKEAKDRPSSAEDGSGKELALPERIEYVEQGTRIHITDDVWIDPIWPIRGTKGDLAIDDPNENNMVYMVNYRGVKIMVTGDLLQADELEMVKYYKGTDVLDCDVLKVAHHGSKSSSSGTFLDAASPEVAVIQVGRDNFYGHPHKQTLDRLEERGIAVFRTDLNGAVGIDIHRKHISIDLFKEVPGL